MLDESLSSEKKNNMAFQSVGAGDLVVSVLALYSDDSSSFFNVGIGGK